MTDILDYEGVVKMTEIYNPRYANNYTPADIEDAVGKEMFQFQLSGNDLDKMASAFNSRKVQVLDDKRAYDNFIRTSGIMPYGKVKLIEGYRQLLRAVLISRNTSLERHMRLKATRGNSGVVVITIFMSGTQFGADGIVNNADMIKRGGCPENCHYCPFERDENGIPTQPRSYLSTEPGNKRATQNKHHPLGQLFDRANTLEQMGHISPYPDTPSKVEVIISGGTFNFYPADYIRWFVTMTYYAMNVYYDYKIGGESQLREMLSLAEEQKLNENAGLRMIGLTIETRPDKLWLDGFNGDTSGLGVVRFFRELGVTRVQIGIQHTSDTVLAYVNRNCTNEDNMQGIRILKQNGFKVDIHLMLDLPMPLDIRVDSKNILPEHLALVADIPSVYHANVLMDLVMIREVITNPDYQADQWKVYPTEVTPYTKILEWYKSGRYVPYAEYENGLILRRVIIYLKSLIHDYIRINRVIRDIPTESIEGGISCPDMRNLIMLELKAKNLVCRCIRCREVKDNRDADAELVMFIQQYEASNGIEYFISWENADKTLLYGMLRLRINRDYEFADPILYGCAMIRELHVYGLHSTVGSMDGGNIQHQGLGKKLINKAEELAYLHGMDYITVISGVGVKEYYRKLGFADYGTYLRKDVSPDMKPISVQLFHTMLYVIMALFIVFMALRI